MHATRAPSHDRLGAAGRVQSRRAIFDGQHIPSQAIADIEDAQAGGHVDPAWQPFDLIVLLFAIGLAWAHLPHPDAVTDDPAVIAARRAAAVEAARRIITTRA